MNVATLAATFMVRLVCILATSHTSGYYSGYGKPQASPELAIYGGKYVANLNCISSIKCDRAQCPHAYTWYKEDTKK